MKNIVFIDDSTSVGNNLVMHPSRRIEVPMMVGIDKSSKSPLFDFGEDIKEHEEQMGDNLVFKSRRKRRTDKQRVFFTPSLTILVMMVSNLCSKLILMREYNLV